MSLSAGREEITVRRLEPRDLPAALAIQARCYPPFLREGRRAFASRLSLAPSHCLAAEEGGSLIGYLLAHGWANGAPPPVCAVLQPGLKAEVLFVHDLSVTAASRGRGVGRELIDRAFELARGDDLHEAELIAVGGAAPYWRALGFNEETPGPELAAKVRGYGADARWMTRTFA